VKIISKFAGALTLLGALGLLCAGPASASTNSVRVTTTDQLIAAMNAAEQTHTPTQINVSAGHYVFTQVFNSTYGGNALPNVTTQISIIGADPTTTILDLGGNNNFSTPRFFTVLPSGNLALRNLTLTGGGGSAACEGFGQDCSEMGGGAVLNIRGVLTITNCALSGNSAITGENLGPLYGGAIESVSGILTIDDTTIEGNTAEGNGGGVALLGGSASISHSIISGNTLYTGQLFDGSFFGLVGGGIFVSSGELTVDSSTISGNFAGLTPSDQFRIYGLGGGIYNGGSVLLTNSAVVDNQVLDYGEGAGIYNSGGMKIENSTIANNVAGTAAGGIFNTHDLLLQGVTLTDNSADGYIIYGQFEPYPAFPANCYFGSTLPCDVSGTGLHSDPGANTQVATSVLANNNGSDCDGVVISDGRNALGTDAGCTWTKSASLNGHSTYDQINVNPMLGAIQDNGVAGNAHYSPLPGSPLIDAGGAIGTFCTPLDQLGNRRVGIANRDAWSICDLGAIEFQP